MKEEMTLWDHAVAYYKDRGVDLTAKEESEKTRLYESWVLWAFPPYEGEGEDF